MKPSRAACKAFRSHLAVLHAAESYRKMTKRFGLRVEQFGILQKIDKYGIFPKDEQILGKLGLLEPQKPKRELLPGEGRVRRKIAGLAKDTKELVLITKGK